MEKLSARQNYLHLVEAKRRAMIKGEKFHAHRRKSSPKWRKIIQENNLLIKKLRFQYAYEKEI